MADKPEMAPSGPLAEGAALRLDRRTRMLYDDRFVFINGESFRAGGRDAKLMHRLWLKKSYETGKLILSAWAGP